VGCVLLERPGNQTSFIYAGMPFFPGPSLSFLKMHRTKFDLHELQGAPCGTLAKTRMDVTSFVSVEQCEGITDKGSDPLTVHGVMSTAYGGATLHIQEVLNGSSKIQQS
jgi:hypothetical protein